MPRTAGVNQQRRAAQREKILAAASRVFARKGMEATMGEIAAEASVSHGLAYHYFESKEAIFRTLAEQLMSPALTTMQRLLEQPGTPGERLAFLISMLVEGRRDHPEFFQLLYQVLGDETTPPDLREQIGQQNQVFRQVLRQLIVEGQASFEVAPGDPDQLVTLVIIYLDGLSRLAGHDPERFRQHFPEVQLFLRIFTPLEDPERRHVPPKPRTAGEQTAL